VGPGGGEVRWIGGFQSRPQSATLRALIFPFPQRRRRNLVAHEPRGRPASCLPTAPQTSQLLHQIPSAESIYQNSLLVRRQSHLDRPQTPRLPACSSFALPTSLLDPYHRSWHPTSYRLPSLPEPLQSSQGPPLREFPWASVLSSTTGGFNKAGDSVWSSGFVAAK
jgi:hypothetical protein